MDKKRKRSLKKIFGIFIVAVLALTFFSKSFYNYRLPVVTVTLPKPGKLSYTVEDTTELSYSHISSCYADMDGRVTDILVKEGERVEKGQCLMKFKLAVSEELQDITAEESGIITSIGVKKGMFVSSMQNTILYGLAKISEEWTAIIFINEEQFEYVTKDSKPTLKIEGMKEVVAGEVRSIIPYADAKKSGYQVEILIRSETELAGKRASITIKKESTQYDTVIPATALHKDAAGYYVLVLKEDDSVLGNVYMAHRMSVDLWDSDEAYCAVGGLPGDEYVILAATNKITDGSRVNY
jgi:multidrug efflux pump subunit AcrA (membrane-fusion protein)